jgi:hypothetical protein
VALEMTSLEDAYLKIVKAEAGDAYKNDEQIQNEFVMRCYKHTEGGSYFFKQIWAMCIRRYIVFIREPRQWFLTISPFINVVTAIAIIYSLIDSKYLFWIVELMFPFILNAGYASTSGIYMLLPIEDRTQKTKHILTLGGMKSLPYWIGLFIADYSLYMIPTALFAIFVIITGLQIFSAHIWVFVFGLLAFGIAIINFTYFLASLFNDQDAAIKCNIQI